MRCWKVVKKKKRICLEEKNDREEEKAKNLSPQLYSNPLRIAQSFIRPKRQNCGIYKNEYNEKFGEMSRSNTSNYRIMYIIYKTMYIYIYRYIIHVYSRIRENLTMRFVGGVQSIVAGVNSMGITTISHWTIERFHARCAKGCTFTLPHSTSFATT